ncbi:hypothetical protein PF007_g31980 [Phytophthora fragariae]|uniref:Uncharacterized protein n=1 Tax=Phytophthora fragariae TaxID=53985 RepID=A0A6A3PQW7_9STRA|nr:hypothetical protein PF007_g31980 [Phytophthora fragariae]
MPCLTSLVSLWTPVVLVMSVGRPGPPMPGITMVCPIVPVIGMR